MSPGLILHRTYMEKHTHTSTHRKACSQSHNPSFMSLPKGAEETMKILTKVPHGTSNPQFKNAIFQSQTNPLLIGVPSLITYLFTCLLTALNALWRGGQQRSFFTGLWATLAPMKHSVLQMIYKLKIWYGVASMSNQFFNFLNSSFKGKLQNESK